jgi:hypothetical protein
MKDIVDTAYKPCENEQQFKHLGNLSDRMASDSEDIIHKWTWMHAKLQQTRVHFRNGHQFTDHNHQINKDCNPLKLKAFCPINIVLVKIKQIAKIYN